MTRSTGERWNCEACGTRLIAAITMGGAIAPIELAPTADGNVLLQRRDSGELAAITMGGPLLDQAREAQVELRRNHFQSDCRGAS